MAVIRGLEDAYDTPTPKVKGTKHDQGKAQYRLLPLEELEGTVKVLEYGAGLYGEGNWKHVPDGYNRYLDATMRHLAKVLGGKTLDDVPDAKGRCSMLPHIDHAIASLIMTRHFWNKDIRLKEDLKL